MPASTIPSAHKSTPLLVPSPVLIIFREVSPPIETVLLAESAPAMFRFALKVEEAFAMRPPEASIEKSRTDYS